MNHKGRKRKKMNSKISVPPRSTLTLDFVDGDLNVGARAVVRGTGSPAAVKAGGTVYCEEDVNFECSLSARSLEAEGNITIHGDLIIEEDVEVSDGRLEVHGKMTANHIDVEEALYVSDDLTTDEVDVGGSLQVDGNVKAEDIDVGGSFRVKGESEIDNVDVGGSMHTESKINIRSLDVGGAARVHGGRIHDVDVGGSFESSAPLEFDKIDVGGTVRLVGNSKGGNVDVGGTLRVEGDLTFEEIEVGGKVDITGSGQGKEVEVGGRVDIGGSLKLSGDLEVGGKADVTGEVAVRNVDVGGTLRARKVTVETRVEVGGSLDAQEGTTAAFVEIGNRGEIRGPVRADEIVIGKDAHVDDVHGRRVVLRTGAQASNVYGEDITIESHCDVSGEVQYTNELRMGSDIRVARQPQKVAKLPS